VKATLINAAWLLATLLTIGIVWIAVTERRVSGWAVLPFAILVFGIGAAWIRGYHKGE
jgi:hypothetical protein